MLHYYNYLINNSIVLSHVKRNNPIHLKKKKRNNPTLFTALLCYTRQNELCLIISLLVHVLQKLHMNIILILHKIYIYYYVYGQMARWLRACEA